MFKIIIAGGRDFNDYELLKAKMDFFLKNKIKEGIKIYIVSGVAKGSDSLGERYARERGYSIISFPANWDRYGLRAGYLRNAEMLAEANAAVVFWNGTSKGSKHMIDIMTKANKPCKTVEY